MANKLQQYFPMIRTRQEITVAITQDPKLNAIFGSWNHDQQEEFLACCTGAKGCKIVYDSFFKEVFNPEAAPERLERFLSLLMKQEVRILQVLPNDSTRLADENSLLIMDIVVELDDHSLANIEIQRMGYMFPGQRSSCYSSDLLLRQYKRVKSEKKERFSYKDIRKVYSIILFERSPQEFHKIPDIYVHTGHYSFNSGLQIELLQEYIFVPLDIFLKIKHNKPITEELDAWLSFLVEDEPDRIIELIQKWPSFIPLYEDIYALCQNMERIMGLFSKELAQLDKNTTLYMIDQMQEEINHKDALLAEKDEAMNATIAEKDAAIAEKDARIAEKDARIAALEKQLAARK